MDIQQLFGMSAVREDQDINLVVNLEQWNDQVFYDRLGTNEEFTTILDMKIPAITIPIKPGRNLAIIVEGGCRCGGSPPRRPPPGGGRA